LDDAEDGELERGVVGQALPLLGQHDGKTCGPEAVDERLKASQGGFESHLGYGIPLVRGILLLVCTKLDKCLCLIVSLVS
jgi:hypothetical protein